MVVVSKNLSEIFLNHLVMLLNMENRSKDDKKWHRKMSRIAETPKNNEKSTCIEIH